MLEECERMNMTATTAARAASTTVATAMCGPRREQKVRRGEALGSMTLAVMSSPKSLGAEARVAALEYR